MERIWKIGLVGVRRGSSYGKLLDHDPRFEIAALCDTSQEALADFQKAMELPDSRCFTDYKRFVRSGDFDAVVIGTPIPQHAEQVVLALDADKHVMSEVTAANTVEGCRQIIDAVRRSGNIYMMAENMVYLPMIPEWRSLIDSGRLGTIFYAEADYLHPIPNMLVDENTGEKKWRSERPPIHYCSHSLGPILYLTGDRIVRAMAVGDAHRILPEGGVGAIDIQVALFQTHKGMTVKMTRTQIAPRHHPIHYWHLLGTKGFIETDRYGIDRETLMQDGLLYVESEMEHTKKVRWPSVDPALPEYAGLGGHGTADYSTLLAFLDALDSGRKPALDEIRAWDMTVPGLIAAESAAKGGAWMDVPVPE